LSRHNWERDVERAQFWKNRRKQQQASGNCRWQAVTCLFLAPATRKAAPAARS